MRGILLLFAAFCYGSAQTADPSLTFEVASVKIAGGEPFVTVRKSSAGGVRASANPIRFSRPRATLASLLMAAYSLKPQQVTGPDWLTTERYAIEAIVPEGATAAQQLNMLQNLLTERFRLKMHRESKELPVYEMVIAKGSSKLKPPVESEKPLPLLQAGGPLALGYKDGVSTVHLHEQGTMEALAARMSGQADRLILDRTGLKGNYEVEMRWTLTSASPASQAAATATDPVVSLFAAFESQLGLKLEPKRGMVDVLVVDHAEKIPTEN